jgi:type II secretory pathway predicted ATPase ExeA
MSGFQSRRLRASKLAERLGLSMAVMGRACHISATAVHGIVTRDAWPVRSSRPVIEAALRDLFSASGATPEEVAGLFEHEPLPTRNRSYAQRNGHIDQPDGPHEEESTDMLLAKQSLSREACKAFRLFANPFDGEVQTDDQMFTSGEIAYVREACMQAAIGGRFVAVVGESGAGKTTIQTDLESRIERDKKPVIVIKPWVLGMEDSDTRGKTLKSTDILASIITTLDPLMTVPQTLQARSNRARDLLSKSTEAGFCHLLVIEEAHSMPEATLKHLKRLHEMRLGRKPMLGILLLGQTELALKLDPRRANLREVTQRCEVVQLLPLDGDLQAYLEHRAHAASRTLGEFIDETGIAEIKARLTVTRPGAGGKTRATSLLYPLAVNNLITAALNTAAELGMPVVNRDVVRSI